MLRFAGKDIHRDPSVFDLQWQEGGGVDIECDPLVAADVDGDPADGFPFDLPDVVARGDPEKGKPFLAFQLVGGRERDFRVFKKHEKIAFAVHAVGDPLSVFVRKGECDVRLCDRQPCAEGLRVRNAKRHFRARALIGEERFHVGLGRAGAEDQREQKEQKSDFFHHGENPFFG